MPVEVVVVWHTFQKCAFYAPCPSSPVLCKTVADDSYTWYRTQLGRILDVSHYYPYLQQ